MSILDLQNCLEIKMENTNKIIKSTNRFYETNIEESGDLTFSFD
jgi:hypothetical protein